ncbi:MAG: hypothetical protein JSS68_15150 [Actinobacteria bacterium]|nr:hypothetical protein [Actinomycetota bacterium]
MMKFSLTKFNKALAATAVAVVAVAAALGFNLDPAAVAAVQGAISTIVVFLVPNSQ